MKTISVSRHTQLMKLRNVLESMSKELIELGADADSEAEWDELMKRANRTTRIRRSVEVTLRNVAPDVAEMERNELTKMIEEAQAAEREAIEAELTRTMKKEDPFLPVLV